jgi:hypothetical protein
MKRLFILLPVFLALFFGCSENPSEVTSKISSPSIEATSDVSNAELDAPTYEELEIKAIEELSRDDPEALHDRHFSFLHGTIRTRCGSEGHTIWGERHCRRVAIALYNAGSCTIVFEIKCGDDRIRIGDPRPGQLEILHGEGDRIIVHCIEHGHRCGARYAIIWLD